MVVVFNKTLFKICSISRFWWKFSSHLWSEFLVEALRFFLLVIRFRNDILETKRKIRLSSMRVVWTEYYQNGRINRCTKQRNIITKQTYKYCSFAFVKYRQIKHFEKQVNMNSKVSSVWKIRRKDLVFILSHCWCFRASVVFVEFFSSNASE